MKKSALEDYRISNSVMKVMTACSIFFPVAESIPPINPAIMLMKIAVGRMLWSEWLQSTVVMRTKIPTMRKPTMNRLNGWSGSSPLSVGLVCLLEFLTAG